MYFIIFSAEISGWIFFQLVFLDRISVVDFCLILLLFLGKLFACLKYLLAIQEARDETFLLSIFLPLQFGPRIRAEGPQSSSR